MVASHFAFAIDPLIYGGWKLKEFTVFLNDSKEGSDFCSGATGQILYEESGHMSVSINCGPKSNKTEPADKSERVLFYAGTFFMNDKKEVVHNVTNSTNTAQIGKQVIRPVLNLTEKELVLGGKFGDTGTLMISWEKLPTAPNQAKPAINSKNEAFAMLTILKVKPGKEEAFKKEIAAIVAPTLSEPENIAWYVQQSQQDSTDFLFYTRWKNNSGLNTHLTSEPLQKYLKNTSDMLVPGHLRLVKYWPIDGQFKTRGELGLIK